MSEMYRTEVPLYGQLVDLVAEVNAKALASTADALPVGQDEIARLGVERHGAVRLGTPEELGLMARIFAVMGMSAVSYYDLSVAGVPVHATAFRPTSRGALTANPFRVFTSLLRLELLPDPEVRRIANEILVRRSIFTQRAVELTARCEIAGGLSAADADEFVREVLQTFRWDDRATVDQATYKRLSRAHRLVADVVCFRGPHINHLTPRTLDIDAAQAAMLERGIDAKEIIEGPPRRRVPILLRQTSFKALEEPVRFADGSGADTHSARFGEIEQRGVALTRKGRVLYDSILESVRSREGGAASSNYSTRLESAFKSFPDDLGTLRREGLAFFRYVLRDGCSDAAAASTAIETLVDAGVVEAVPITYEDFLPVSAAGIFQSNLGGTEQRAATGSAAQRAFEQALGARVIDEFDLYESEQAASMRNVIEQLRAGPLA